MFNFLISLFLASQSLQLTTVTATWDPNPESDIAGYKLLYGTASGQYTTVIDTRSPVDTLIVTGLQFNTKYYFALVAYDTAGLISPDSVEVVYNSQANLCLDSNGNPAVQLRVLSFTPSLAAGGLGQLLWTIISVNRIVNITATLNGNAVSVIDGADSRTLDLARSAGVNFTAPSTSGNYTLVVSATDINGCKADTSSVSRIVNVP